LTPARREHRSSRTEWQAALEERLWRNAADFAAAIGGEWDRCVSELESRLEELVGLAVRRLVGDTPAADRLRGCVRQLVAQAGAPETGTLLVAEADHAAVVAFAGRLPWPVQPSNEVAPGSVRLVSAQGRWDCDIHSALARLLQAVGAPLESGAEQIHE
jgi:flagellar biosynthesis/type III secretory pathway protein FliH